jgi:phage baseplate assembly protein W
MSQDFFGRGFLFPPEVDPQSGRIATIGGGDVVEQALRILLRTAPGERLMRPDYGCGLRRYLFEPNTATTRRLIQEEITQSIARYEDRVRVDAVEVTADDIDPAQVNIDVRYTLKRTGAQSTLSETMSLRGSGSS